MGVAPHGSRKIAMLTTDQALPILDYEILESVVKESEFVAGKDTKQVAVKIPEDLGELERSRIVGTWWEHAPQHVTQGARPVSQGGCRSLTCLDCRHEVGPRKRALFPAQPTLFPNESDKTDQAKQRAQC
jgi:hypothetical protein